MFPFNEETGTMIEVCTLRPKYSYASLISQVHLVKEGKLTNNAHKMQDPLVPEVSVQEDILAHTCKIKRLLTNSQQIEKEHSTNKNFEFLENSADENVINQFYFTEKEQKDIKIEISEDTEHIFEVEKVCSPNFYNPSSYMDLDFAIDRASVCVSDYENISELGSDDVEMHEEQDEFIMNQINEYQYYEFTKPTVECENSNLTFSCTHSYVG
jgi:hypothetical protein